MLQITRYFYKNCKY